MNQLRRMFDHLAWADERAIGALRQSVTDQVEALRLLAHILATEHVWLSRIRERAPRVAIWPELSLHECAALARENQVEYRSLLDSLDPETLAAVCVYRSSTGAEFRTAVGDILVHVALHGSYHRGQVAAALRRAGAEPVNTDYITFAREGISTPVPPV